MAPLNDAGHCIPCAGRQRRVVIAARRARAVPFARDKDSPSQPQLAKGTRLAVHEYAASRAWRSLRDEYALCRPPTRRDRTPQPQLAKGTRLAANICANNGASRSQRDEHMLCCLPRDTTALPSCSW
jgi:hypothetical protein